MKTPPQLPGIALLLALPSFTLAQDPAGHPSCSGCSLSVPSRSITITDSPHVEGTAEGSVVVTEYDGACWDIASWYDCVEEYPCTPYVEAEWSIVDGELDPVDASNIPPGDIPTWYLEAHTWIDGCVSGVPLGVYRLNETVVAFADFIEVSCGQVCTLDIVVPIKLTADCEPSGTWLSWPGPRVVYEVELSCSACDGQEE